MSDGSLYPALHKLEQEGWIKAEWKITENGRRAQFYTLTRPGRQMLEREAANWERLAGAISHIVRAERGMSMPSPLVPANGPSSPNPLPRNRIERELEDEFQFHIEQRTAFERAKGLRLEQAHLVALRAMEGMTQRKEQCRDKRRVN